MLQMRPDHLLETPFLNFLSFEARPGLVITSSSRETSHLCHGRGLKPFLLEATWVAIVFSNSGRMIEEDLGQKHHVALFSAEAYAQADLCFGSEKARETSERLI